jgi:hypothetical protein
MTIDPPEWMSRSEAQALQPLRAAGFAQSFFIKIDYIPYWLFFIWQTAGRINNL